MRGKLGFFPKNLMTMLLWFNEFVAGDVLRGF